MDNTDMNTIVDNLADKIGIAAERLAPIAETVVRETYAYGVGLLLLGLLYGIVAGILGLFAAWHGKRINLRENENVFEGLAIATVFFGVGTIVMLVVAAATLSDAISPLTRPTWVALKSLL